MLYLFVISSLNVIIDQSTFYMPHRFLHRYASKSRPMAEDVPSPQPSSDSVCRAHVSEILVNTREEMKNKEMNRDQPRNKQTNT